MTNKTKSPSYAPQPGLPSKHNNPQASLPGFFGGDGFVVGPASAVDGNVAVFNGTDGQVIKDGGTPPLIISGTQKLTVSATPPVSPSVGDLWVDIS